MTLRPLPDEVRQTVESYLELTDKAVPGLIEGLYLHRSLTYGDFRPAGYFGRNPVTWHEVARRAGLGRIRSGPARLHHLLATDRLTSKTGAGRRALTAFGERWQPIVHEALRMRAGSVTSVYEGGPGARLRDTIAFAAMVIEAGRQLGP